MPQTPPSFWAGKLTRIKDLDLRLIGMVFEKNGDIVATARELVLGNRPRAVSWLANTLSQVAALLFEGQKSS